MSVNAPSIASFSAHVFSVSGLGNAKATTNSSKSNDDNEKNVKKSNDDKDEPGDSTPLGEIPKIEKYIANTRIDGLQTLYQVHSKYYTCLVHYDLTCFSHFL